MENILWHTEKSCGTFLTMMIGLYLDIVTEDGIFNDESGLIWQSHVPILIVGTGNVRRTIIIKVLCFLPIHEV